MLSHVRHRFTYKYIQYIGAGSATRLYSGVARVFTILPLGSPGERVAPAACNDIEASESRIIYIDLSDKAEE